MMKASIHLEGTGDIKEFSSAKMDTKPRFPPSLGGRSQFCRVSVSAPGPHQPTSHSSECLYSVGLVARIC